MVFTGDHDPDKCPEAPTSVDDLAKKIFNLPMIQFFELMTKVQEKMMDFQTGLENLSFK